MRGIALLTESGFESRLDELLARHDCFSRADELPADGELYAWVDAQGLQLRQSGKGAPGSLLIDFTDSSLAYRLRQGGGLKEPLARAVGVRGNHFPSVIDATAGIGRDAFILAALGCKLRLIERQPVVHALLEDALLRGSLDSGVCEVIARMELLADDSIECLVQLEDENVPDVIYLDPMFPERKKSALVKKEMRYFHALVGSDTDSDELLGPARQSPTDSCDQLFIFCRQFSDNFSYSSR